MNSEFDQIRRRFNDNQLLPLSEEWLEGCIQWCKSDNLPQNYSLDDLYEMILEQWLVLDLRDIEIQSLPPQLKNKIKYSLTGVFCLQVMQVVDISKPKLWQLQRIRNSVAKNTVPESDFGKRVLQMTLSDGVQEVEAMEFKPIPCLNINLTPGTKLKLTGPITVRKGRLMLEERHVKCLGGSVDDLMIKNAAENVLARALGLEENPNPFRIDEAALEVQTQNNTIQQTQLHQNNVPNIHNRNTNLQNRNTNPQNRNTNPQHRMQISRNQDIPPEFHVDDDLLRELETHFEEESARNQNIQHHSAKNKTNIAKPNNLTAGSVSPDIFGGMDEDDKLLNQHLDLINIDNEIMNTEQPGLYERQRDSTLKSRFQDCKNSQLLPQPERNDDVITLDDTFDNIDIDSHLDNIDEELARMPCSTQKIETLKVNLKSPTLLKTPRLSLSKSLPQKKMTQSKLAFKNYTLFDQDNDEDDFEKPVTSFPNTNQKSFQDVRSFDSNLFNKSYNTKPSTEIKQHLSGSVRPTLMDKEILSPTSETSSTSLTQPPLTQPSRKIITIEKLSSMIPNITKGKFKLKARFISSAERLKLTTEGFYLVIKIEDNTGILVVELDPSIIEGLAELSTERVKELRIEAYNQDSAARNVIRQALLSIMNKIKNLNNIVEVQVTRGERYPILTKIMEEM